jgi:hypothetical protein
MPEDYDEEKKVKSFLIMLGNILLIFVLILICASCTVNIVMTHSQGAGDCVTAEPEVEAEADLKMIPLFV